jgi:hypothetical protein
MTFAKCQASRQKVGAPASNKKEQENNGKNSAYSS